MPKFNKEMEDQFEIRYLDVNKMDSEFASDQHCSFEKMITRYSDLFRLRRAVVWLLRFKVLLKDKSQQAKFFTNEDSANICIMSYLQHKSLGDDLRMLQGRKPLSKSNNLNRLEPFIGEDGLLRVGGTQ